MYFEFVKKLELPRLSREFKQRPNLWQTTKSIEENIRIQPNEAVKKVRDAMDILIKGLLKEDGYHDTQNFVPLKDLIDTYGKRCDFIQNKQVDSLQDLRRRVNGSAHPNPHYTIDDAFSCAKTLYDILGGIFELNLPEMMIEMLPIGQYRIVRKIKSEDFESVCGDYNYFAESDVQNAKTYVYIRLFNKNEKSSRVFDERDAAVQAFFRNMRGSKYIMKANEIPTGDTCNIRYLAYETHENTQRLSEIDVSDLSSLDVLEIISQIVQGLSELSSKSINIHHRGIRPECIFLDKDDEGYFAKLGCFETAKIQTADKNMKTVMAYMKETQKDNLFIHPVLRYADSANETDWERGDVYSLACLFLYCLDYENFTNGMINPEVLLDYYSDEFEEIAEMIFSGQLPNVPLMKEFLEILRSEIRNGEN